MQLRALKFGALSGLAVALSFTENDLTAISNYQLGAKTKISCSPHLNGGKKQPTKFEQIRSWPRSKRVFLNASLMQFRKKIVNFVETVANLICL